MSRRCWCVLLSVSCLGVAVSATVRGASASLYEVDRDRSRAVIEVGKAGALSFLAGHTHEVVGPIAGVVHLDQPDGHSDVQLEIDAGALRVTGKGDPPDDVPKVQQAMLSDQVLDVRHYPLIVFRSLSVTIKTQTPTALDLAVAGQLTLHNVTRSFTVPVKVALDGDQLTATGAFPLKQTDFGIRPISVGGVVAVRDTLNISFTIIARAQRGA